MRSGALAALVAACLLGSTVLGPPAWAENQMGYRLLTPQEAAALPHNQGALGLNVDRGQRITDGGMTFDIIRVTGVRRGSTGAAAGLKTGDQIIAMDGRVFPSLDAFAAYIGGARPGSQISVDYMPAGGGPGQAQRAAVAVGQAGQSVAPPTAKGMSTGEKVAIGAGAVALLGCYEMGCFSHRRAPNAASNVPQQAPR